MRIIRQSLHVLLDAFYRFNRDDGWAIASHIALSILMSVFPEPMNAAMAVTTMRNGNTDIRIDKAIWLAIAQPSSRLKR